MRKIAPIFTILLPVIIFMSSVITLMGCESQRTAQAEELKAKIRRVIIEAWNKGNLDALDELYAVDFVRHRPPFPDYKGLGTHKQRVAVIRSAYPDHQTIIHDIILEGDTAVLWYTWQGTHTGEGLSIPPSGKRVEVTGCDVYHLIDGKVVEEWDHEGFLSLYQQLGYQIIPPHE